MFAFVRRNDYCATVEFSFAVGVLCLGLPLANNYGSGDVFLTSLLSSNSDWAWVDFVSVMIGASLIAGAFKLPQQRPLSAREKQKLSSEPEPNAALAPTE